MSNWPRRFLLLIMLASLGRVVADDDDHDHERARHLQESGVIVPLEKVVAQVQAAYPHSKVLEAKLKDKKHLLTYEIEIVDQAGVVREMYFDARSGELYRSKQE